MVSSKKISFLPFSLQQHILCRGFPPRLEFLCVCTHFFKSDVSYEHLTESFECHTIFSSQMPECEGPTRPDRVCLHDIRFPVSLL